MGFTPAKICMAEKGQKLKVKQLLGSESCIGCVQTAIQTLDGIYVHQPHHFLPLAKEAKKISRGT